VTTRVLSGKNLATHTRVAKPTGTTPYKKQVTLTIAVLALIAGIKTNNNKIIIIIIMSLRVHTVPDNL